MKFEITISGFIRDPDGNPISADQLETLCDLAMDELIALGVENPAIEGVGKTATFEISLVVEEGNEQEAISKASYLVRCAVHAAGVTTHEWPVKWYAALDPRSHLVDA